MSGRKLHPIDQAAAEEAFRRVLERRYPGCSVVIVREDEGAHKTHPGRTRKFHGIVGAPHDVNPAPDIPAAAA